MAIQRFIEFIPYVWREWEKDVAAINTWLGIITSALIAVGIILIRQIFDFLKKAEKQRQEADKKVLNAVIQAEEKRTSPVSQRPARWYGSPIVECKNGHLVAGSTGTG